MDWLKKGLIFNTTGVHSWSISHAQVPVVDKVNNEIWRIYYSTRDNKNQSTISYIEVESNNPSNIVYKHQSPILEKGELGCFDDSGVMPTCIITVNEKKYLYYIGWTTGVTIPYRNSIGLAISEDSGKTFQKYSMGPIMGTGLFDSSFVGTIFVYKDTSNYHGYYLSCSQWKNLDGKPEPFYDIKHSISVDGIHWERDGIVAIPLKGNEGGIASASVIKNNEKYYMWYSVRKGFDYRKNKLNSYKIGYAESLDLINWNRQDDIAGISQSKEGWDSEMIAYPNIIKSDGKLYMFYNGNGFGKTGFGYAELLI
jgi:hypothetical protein